MNKYKKVSAYKYWTKYLKNALYYSGWLPQKMLYIITYCKALQKYITPDIVISYYKQEKDNLKTVLNEILYNYNIDTKYISQSYNVRDLEELINDFYDVVYIDNDDKNIYIKEK